MSLHLILSTHKPCGGVYCSCFTRLHRGQRHSFHGAMMGMRRRAPQKAERGRSSLHARRPQGVLDSQSTGKSHKISEQIMARSDLNFRKIMLVVTWGLSGVFFISIYLIKNKYCKLNVGQDLVPGAMERSCICQTRPQIS